MRWDLNLHIRGVFFFFLKRGGFALVRSLSMVRWESSISGLIQGSANLLMVILLLSGRDKCLCIGEMRPV